MTLLSSPSILHSCMTQPDCVVQPRTTPLDSSIKVELRTKRVRRRKKKKDNNNNNNKNKNDNDNDKNNNKNTHFFSGCPG